MMNRIFLLAFPCSVCSWVSNYPIALGRLNLQRCRHALKIPASRIQEISDAGVEDSESHQQRHNPTTLSPLSYTIEELGSLLGGKGRAQACWDCLKLGIDPLWYFDDGRCEDTGAKSVECGLLVRDNDSSMVDILSKLPRKRQSQGMGKLALDKFTSLFGGSIEATIADLLAVNVSNDGTVKLLLQMKQDGLEVETVIIPWPDRKSSTLCISSQVGCRQGCTFCATGKMGKLRSLSSNEILAQVYWAQRTCRLNDIYPIDNIVFMGMGEPADNVENVVGVCRILTDRKLFQLAGRRITVSTVGPTPKSFLALSEAPVALAWSVHAANNDVRKSLVPTTKYSMEELRDEGLIPALQQRPKRLRTTMLEVTLLDHINDSEQEALELVRFCQPLLTQVDSVKLVVNLIPWNDIFQSASDGAAKSVQGYRQPTMARVQDFQRILLKNEIMCYIRTTRGDDESAACGQLATKSKRVQMKRTTPQP